MIKLIDSLSQTDNSIFKIEILNEPIMVRKMMLEGTADFAILPGTMSAITYNKGLDYKLIAVPVWGTLYLFGSDSTIHDWADLKGKRIHLMARGMTPDVLFRYLLTKNGIDPETNVTLDYSFPTHIDLAHAIAAGQANMGVISEPLVSLVMQKNKNVRPVFNLDEEWKKVMNTPLFETAFIGKKDVLENNRQATEELISAYRASTNWVNKNPESAAELIVKYGILPDYNAALHAIPRSNLKFVRAKEIEQQIEEYLNVFFEMNPDIIGGKIPDENFIYK
ncbi:MAG: ABC transporter substrate-binding protein [Prolixibacteraceae bacterium]|nr:ABC transporter substrate-binding protein [Prolixibacteraceae bacterium]